LLTCRLQWLPTPYIWSSTRASRSSVLLHIPDVLTCRLQCQCTQITVHEMNTHIHSLKTQVMNTHVHSLDAHEIETNVMNIYILWIYMRCIYICILSASCEQDCNFVSTRICILVVFFQVVPHSQCVWWRRPTQHASRQSTLSFTPRVS